jgi:hypothetical protein
MKKSDILTPVGLIGGIAIMIDGMAAGVSLST